jgi:hypothetical protein
MKVEVYVVQKILHMRSASACSSLMYILSLCVLHLLEFPFRFNYWSLDFLFKTELNFGDSSN